MATKKTQALAVKPKGGLSPVSAAMMAAAKKGVAKFNTGSPRISFKGGRISIDKNPVKDNKLPIAIITTVLGKAYYDKPYEEGRPATPVCYAFHPDDPTKFVPHAASPDRQAENCSVCPLNKFGTALVGKGKACRDLVRVMGVVPSEEDFTGAEARSFDITGHSLKGWSTYADQLQMIDRSPLTVVTELSTEPKGGAFVETFTHHDDLTEEQFSALSTRVEAAQAKLMEPYPALDDEEEAPPKKTAAPQRKRKF
jgi:hypothetical protein